MIENCQTNHTKILLSIFHFQASVIQQFPIKMHLKIVILFLTCVLQLSSNSKISSSQTKLLNLLKINSHEKWDKLCQHLILMIMSSDAGRRDSKDVAILFLETVNVKRKYEGFDEALAKFSKGSFAIRKANNIIPKVLINGRKSFLIFLINDLIPNYQYIVQNYFRRVFPDTSLKIFIILSNYKNRNSAMTVWEILAMLKYSNIYIIFHENSGEFSIFRTMIERSSANNLRLYIKESNDSKFLVMKEVISTTTVPLRIVHYDSYPMSYLKNGSVIGADENLIYEFSKKLNTQVQIANRQSSSATLLEIYNYLETTAEISIHLKTAVYNLNLVNIWLNEQEGICLLVPRNIPVVCSNNFTIDWVINSIDDISD